MLRLVINSAQDRSRAVNGRLLKPIRPSRRAELWYLDKLRSIVKAMKAAGAAVGRELKPRWNPPASKAQDAAPDLTAIIGRGRKKFVGIKAVAESLAAELAEKNRAEVDARIAEQIGDAVGINLAEAFTRPLSQQGSLAEGLADAMDEARRANVELITSLPEEYFDLIEEAVTKSWAAGGRWEDVAERLAEIDGISEGRADTIARDQTSKMNASFNEARQSAAGIEEYEWSGSLDEPERESHRDMEGTRHRWDDPPLVDDENVHPGEAILCRCVAIPVFKAAEESGGEEDGEEAEAA